MFGRGSVQSSSRTTGSWLLDTTERLRVCLTVYKELAHAQRLGLMQGHLTTTASLYTPKPMLWSMQIEAIAKEQLSTVQESRATGAESSSVPPES